MVDSVQEHFADEDPEYATDAAAGIDSEQVEFELDDPTVMPKDQGDSGTADRPGGAG
jgi:hypothetical protein